MRVADRVEMLELDVTFLRGSATICPTLIWDENGAILIDAGLPGNLELFREAMRQPGISFDQIHTVILTHQDIDHIGSIPDIIKQSNRPIEILAHELDQPYIEGKLPIIKTNLKSMAKELETFSEDVRKIAIDMCENPPKAKVTRTLTDGEELPYCGGIRVIFTPGHTPGHISLYLKQSKTLIAGDALFTDEEGVLYGPVPRVTVDMNQAQESLKKFLDYDIETVVCYHGGITKRDIAQQFRNLGRF